MTPETYSGVAVVPIDITDSDRSVGEPSRMPANTPMIRATGIMVIMTQNISLAVAHSAGKSLSATRVLNLVEQPKSPWITPEKVGSTGSLQKEKRCAALPVSGSMIGTLGTTPSHWP